jgi:predicted restriction endonuclease
MSKTRGWDRDELLMAMNLYCRLPFGKMHKGNADIIALANMIGRTPSSVAMKLGNFAALDPVERARGIRGLSKASAADKAVWAEFHENWEEAVDKSNDLLSKRVESPSFQQAISPSAILPTDDQIAARGVGPTETIRSVRVRLAQAFFRRAVLASYGCRCCVSSITLDDLLVASHILPWGQYPAQRANPCNGLCLSRLHDAAFDRGLITFDDQFRLVISTRLKEHVTNRTLSGAFAAYEGKGLALPEKFLPDQGFLEIHRQTVFAA